MNDTEMMVVFLVVILVIACAMVGIGWLIVKGLFAIWDKYHASQGRKAMQFHRVMKTATDKPLYVAVEILNSVGIRYDLSKKCVDGRRIVLPKYFWAGGMYKETTTLRAITLITIATWAIASECSEADVTAELMMTLINQGKRTPAEVIAVHARLTQFVEGNTKLSEFRDRLDRQDWCW